MEDPYSLLIHVYDFQHEGSHRIHNLILPDRQEYGQYLNWLYGLD
jgi:hypothetical protein